MDEKYNGRETINIIKNAYIFQKTNVHCNEQVNYINNKHVSEFPKAPPGKDYWENKLRRLKYYSYNKTMVANILNERVGFLLDYFERLSENKLTIKELNKPNPQDFKGPYLPIPKEIEVSDFIQEYVIVFYIGE